MLRGVAVLFAGNLAWAVLFAPLNLKVLPMLPWAVLPMAVYLRLYWRYIGGRIGCATTAETRRENLRANPLALEVWALAIVSGLIGFGALLALTAVMARLMPMPASPIGASSPLNAAAAPSFAGGGAITSPTANISARWIA